MTCVNYILQNRYQTNSIFLNCHISRKHIYIMKSFLYISLLFLSAFNVNAQVGIGTTVPDASSMLDISSLNSGLLIPRVPLLSTSDVTTIAAPLTSLLVYNSGFAPNGYYYWNGLIWTPLSGAAASGWLTTGNAGIVGTTNFMGTDAATNADVAFRRFNLPAGKLSATSTSFGVGALSAGAATNNAAFGNNALTLSTGADDVAVGPSALAGNTTGTANTAFGKSALAANSTGAQNTAVGTNALALNTTTGNTAIGYNAGTANTTATGNTAVGFTALSTTSTGADNTAVGYQALKSTTGAQNTAVGVNALQLATTGAANTAVGHSALSIAGTFSNSTAVGYQALWKNTGTNVTGVGFQALANNTASNVTAFGFQALAANTSGTENTAVGYLADSANTTAIGNTSLGYFALNGNNSSNNTAIGGYALGRNTGSSNTAVGYQAEFGSGANFSNTTAIGFFALFNNQASNNTAVGWRACNNNSTGAGNTAVGYQSFLNNTTGGSNTAVGFQAGFNITTSNNTLIGYNAGQQAGANNTAVGTNALSATGGAINNVAIGYNALLTSVAGTNTAIGVDALSGNSAGSGNVALGYNAGKNEITSNKLYISNSATTPTTSLIYGDFTPAARILRTNSTFQIGDPAGTGYVFPAARGTVNQVLQTDAVGVLTWVSPAALTIIETDPQVSSVATSSVPRWNGATLVDGVITDDGTNVGIGIAASAGNKLEVAGKTKTTNFQMTTGGTANYILQSDASGNGSWVNATVLPYTTTGAATGIYTILLTQYTVRVFNGVSEVRLPDAVANPGKVYIIIGSNTISSKILSTSGGLIYDDVPNTFISTITTNQRLTVQSDGADWIVIGR